MVDLFILNSDGVIDELLTKYSGSHSNVADIDADAVSLMSLAHNMTHGSGHVAAKAQATKKPPTGHCTGFVRLTEDRSELFFGHTTWESFSEMTRVWKVYDLPLAGTASRKASFSSYPGCVSSTDDFYLLDSGLAITETTLNIPKEQIYPVGDVYPDFLRIMAANRLSKDGNDWVSMMTLSATGTYSSQWLVVDYNKFSSGAPLPSGAFYVLEQAPGVSRSEDMSQVLMDRGYWASFDRAYFEDVRRSTGDDSLQRSGGPVEASLYSRDRTPRAQIAAESAASVNSLAAMRSQMTENRGEEEPVDVHALRNPRYAFAARDDLKDAMSQDIDGSPDGGVDAKITSSCLFQKLTAQAISGPSHSDMSVFRWVKEDGTEAWPGYPHEGLPDVAAFDWVSVAPGANPIAPLDSNACP
mmetsp:Transcript_91527/g.191324  ORF Transcript_91527/g.191324 Transcript_91527/m.191324 type:complete len:413 (-) Transcript_91527:39-1277(-)